MTISQLRAARLAALKRAEAAALLAAATGATEDAVAQATADQDAALDEVDDLDAKIASATASNDSAASATARADRLAAARASSAARSGSRTQPRTPITSRPASEGAPNAGFANQRQYLTAVLNASVAAAAGNPEDMDDRLRGLLVKVGKNGIHAAAGSDEQGEYSNGYGGFLLPEQFQPNLLTVAAESDPTIGRTTAIPMGAPTVRVNARVDKNHSTSVTGGLTVVRRSEAATVAASRMEFEQIKLDAELLMGLSFATEELLADSPQSLAAIIQAGFRDEIGAKLLNEKIDGTGVGQFTGVLKSTAKVTIAKEPGQAANTIVYDNVVKMRSQAWGYGRAIWLANHGAFPQLSKMSLAVGTGGAPVYMPSVVEDRPDLLLGRPIFYTEYAKTLGTEGDLILCDWSQYLEGMLQGETISESVHVRFDTNERAFKVVMRNAGAPWWRTPLTPKNGPTMSPIVTLAVRA